MKAPFPWFGGKSKVAPIIWQRFGDVQNYVEPFAGSLAVLLGRPKSHKNTLETVNDYDGFISNFWRALKSDPEAVAHYADWPANENDMHARHVWLLGQIEDLRPRLEGDWEYYDAKVAGFWVWGISLWIGSGWCGGDGPWQPVEMEDGTRKLIHLGNKGQGVHRQLIHLGDKGQGVHRQLIHLGDKGQGVHRQRIHLGNKGQGVHRQRISLGQGGTGQGIHSKSVKGGLYDYMLELSERLRNVRVASGDWSRVCGPSVTFKHGRTGIFLDPPYNEDAERVDLYRIEDKTISTAVREWAVENGDNPKMLIALCGYEQEHGPHMPDDWECHEWKANGGYDGQRKNGTNDNAGKERIWFSPHCLNPLEDILTGKQAGHDNLEALPLFGAVG